MKYVTIQGTTAIIKVTGRYDLINTREVVAEVEVAINNKGCNSITVDFENTTYLDSSVIRDLTKLRRKVKPENFTAKNAKDIVLEMLKRSKLDNWLQ